MILSCYHYHHIARTSSGCEGIQFIWKLFEQITDLTNNRSKTPGFRVANIRPLNCVSFSATSYHWLPQPWCRINQKNSYFTAKWRGFDMWSRWFRHAAICSPVLMLLTSWKLKNSQACSSINQLLSPKNNRPGCSM